jgi:hypothetical protein
MTNKNQIMSKIAKNRTKYTCIRLTSQEEYLLNEITKRLNVRKSVYLRNLFLNDVADEK